MADARDIIVVGGSAGSLEALIAILRRLGADLAAAILLVVHSAQNSPGYLANILSQATSLKVRYAADREPIEFGTIYVAPRWALDYQARGGSRRSRPKRE
jgi:two-component system chemotaxis response regulator CheB